ncbi:LuxR C-terminal-related transcriptional regulator [Hydrocarboniphaga sp.]|uniref:helix-turn-helix transcriptional regulator n=1 Tax=Hydrocarboniphaga sp. TaxID=2033016 RepID=UPI003D101C52
MSPATPPPADLLPLIRTKLAPPRVASAPVERRALLQELESGRDRKLSLVMGPAGSGKTSLLVQWRKALLQRGAAVAWYNLGADDDDVHVATYIVEALRQAGSRINADGDGDGLKLFVRSGGRAWQHLLATLINDLGDSTVETYLMIDDFHHLGSFPMLQLIDRWLALAPAGMHLVLGSRARPPLDLPRLSAEEQFTEIRFDRLRFDFDETRRFVAARGLNLSAARIGNLQTITDGWAAGLQLLTFSLRNDTRSEAVLDQQDKLSLSQEDALTRYLETSAVHQLSEAELNFLTRVSACRRFNRELCQLLTGDPDADTYLAKFEAENLFLLPIDTSDAEPWYRFHRLFATFLNKRLARLGDVDLHNLHRLASHWFAGRNMHVEALRHADLGRDVDFLVELVDRAGRRMTNGAQYLEFLAWYDKLPADKLGGRINILMCAAQAQVSCNRLEQLDRTLAIIESHAAYARPEIRSEVLLCRAYRHLRQDDTAAQWRAIAEVQRALPLPPAQSWQLSSVTGFSLIYSGRFEEARELVRSRFRHGELSRRDQAVPFVDMISGVSFLVQGNFRLASEQLLPVLDSAMRLKSLDTDAAGIIVGYLIEGEYQLGRLDQTRELLEQHQELIDAVGLPDSVLMSYRVRARIERIDKDDASALHTLKRLEEAGYRMGLERLVAWSLHDQLQLALDLHEMARQRELLSRLAALAQRYPPDSGVRDEIRLAAALAHADASFAQADDRSALLAIDSAIGVAAGSGRQLAQTRLGLLRAMLLLRSGQAQEAAAAAAGPLRKAIELGMLRVVADLGAAALPLIERLGNSAELADCHEFLLASRRLIEGDGDAEPAAPQAAVAGDGSSAKLLSVREREVLELLSRAYSAKTIARQLSLSPGTVKWHLRNIYGKLGAATREDALAKARALDILR